MANPFAGTFGTQQRQTNPFSGTFGDRANPFSGTFGGDDEWEERGTVLVNRRTGERKPKPIPGGMEAVTPEPGGSRVGAAARVAGATALEGAAHFPSLLLSAPKLLTLGAGPDLGDLPFPSVPGFPPQEGERGKLNDLFRPAQQTAAGWREQATEDLRSRAQTPLGATTADWASKAAGTVLDPSNILTGSLAKAMRPLKATTPARAVVAAERRGLSLVPPPATEEVVEETTRRLGQIQRNALNLGRGEVPLVNTGDLPGLPTQVTNPQKFKGFQTNLAAQVGSQEVRDYIAARASKISEAIGGPQSWDELEELAIRSGTTKEEFLKKNPRFALLPPEERSRLTMVIKGSEEEIGTIQAKLRDATATEADKGRLVQLLGERSNLIKLAVGSGSEYGRALNSLKMQARASLSDSVLARQTLYRKFRSQFDKDDALMTRLAEVNPSSPQELHSLLREVEQATGASSIGEKVKALYKTGLLTNPLTHVVNMIGTSTSLAVEAVKDAPGALMDRLMSIRTGTRALAGPSRKQFLASVQGAKRGVEAAKEVMKYGATGDELLHRMDLGRHVNFGDSTAGKVGQAYYETVLRTLDAPDQFNRSAAIYRSLQNQADALKVKIDLANPPEDFLARAIVDAEEEIFRDQTAIGKALGAAAKVGHGAMEYLIPFQRTPGAIATRTAEYTPLGLTAGMAKSLNVMLKGAKASVAEQRAAAKLVGRGATGTGLIALGMYLRARGLATGMGAKEEPERSFERDMGRQESSVRNPFKPPGAPATWWSVGRLNPAGNLIAMGATLYDKMKEGSSPVETLGATAAAGGRLLLDQPFMTGFSRIQGSLESPENKGMALVRDQVASAVPAIVGAAARGTDPYVRERQGLSGAIKSRIPGASESLPPALTVLGEPQKRQGGLTDAMLNPFKRSTETSDPVLRELASIGVPLGMVAKRLTNLETGENEKLSPEDYRRYQELAGQEVKAVLSEVFADPAYQALGLEERRIVVEQEILRARAVARAKFRGF